MMLEDLELIFLFLSSFLNYQEYIYNQQCPFSYKDRLYKLCSTIHMVYFVLSICIIFSDLKSLNYILQQFNKFFPSYSHILLYTYESFMEQLVDQGKKYLEQFFPYKRKKAIEDWDFIMVFEDLYKEQIQMFFSKLKCQEDFQLYIVDHPEQKQTFFLLKFSDRVVEEQAHELRILKKKDKKSFKLKLKDLNAMIYTTNQDPNNHFYNYLCFLKARLDPKHKKIYDQQKYSVFNKNKKDMYELEPDGKLFSENQQFKAKYNFLLNYEEISSMTKTTEDQNSQNFYVAPFVNIMKHLGFVELVPIQKVSKHRPLMFGDIKQSAGPNNQCYFDFVFFLQKWLIIPVIIGLITVFVNTFYEYTADDSPADFVYAFFIMVWSIFFISKWQDVDKWKRVEESSGTSDLWEEHQNIIEKRNFERRTSNITGRIQFFLPFEKKVLFYVASFIICTSLMILTLIFMVLSLNARGFIDPSHKLFYFEQISSWADKGGIFDANTMWGQIPNIFHVVITNVFDEVIYRPIAKKLAKLERHLTPKGHESSIIIKYFIYEFVITFADLFYIAFVRFDIVGLREQLLSLFFIDIVRRLVAQSFLPWLKKTYRSKLLKKKKVTSLKQILQHASQISLEQELRIGAILQVNKQQHQLFDDYLEIITNLGYLVMISSCFPLAPFLVLIAHAVEILQDKYKIVHIFKKKLPQKFVGMGDWKNIILFLCYFSVVTNILLFAFSSQQIVSVFPKMFDTGKDLLYGNTDLSELVGGTATSLFGAMMNISSLNLTDAQRTGWDWGSWEQSETLNETAENQLFQGQQMVDLEIETSEKIPEGANLLFGTPQQPEEDPEIQYLVPPKKKKESPMDLNIPLSNLEDPELPPPQIVQYKNNVQPNADVLKVFGNLGKPKEEETPTLTTITTPSKDNETTFIALLFIIEHFFLGLFIFIRKIVAKQECEADIFLKRRQYKRRIKKHLPKELLSGIVGNVLVNELLIKKSSNSSNSSDQKVQPGILGALLGTIPSQKKKEKEQPFNIQKTFSIVEGEDKMKTQ